MSLRLPVRRLDRHLHRFVVIPCVVVMGACSSDGAVGPEDPSLPVPTLRPGAWHLHAADGQALPALVAHRMLAGNVLEQSFADSSRLDVSANGQWEQRTWLRHYENLEFARTETVYDAGTWTRTGDQSYLFTSTVRSREFRIVSPLPAALRIVQPILTRPEAGLVDGTFRDTPRPVGLASRWRATHVGDRPLPAVAASLPHDEYDGAPVSSHVVVDSVVVELHPTHRYRMTEWISWWIGPPSGGPAQRIYGTRHNDWGAWREIAGQVQFSSTLYANRGWFGQRSAAGGALSLAQPIGLDAGVVRTVVYGAGR